MNPSIGPFRPKQYLATFCVPVFNRLEQLQATLPTNLDALSAFKGRFNLIVGAFDAHRSVDQWLNANFQDKLAEDLLEFRQFPAMNHWHVARAKNAFFPYINARYYGSLDADNFLTVNALEVLASLLAPESPLHIVHHFTGQWGDGSAGRLIFTTAGFESEGPYLDSALPQQYDDMAVLLRLISAHPNYRFVSRPAVDIFGTSITLATFLRQNRLSPPVRLPVDLGEQIDALDPKGRTRLERDERLVQFQGINVAYAGWYHSTHPGAKAHFLKQLQRAQREFVRTRSCQMAFGELFKGLTGQSVSKSDALTLYAVRRGEEIIDLNAWSAHWFNQGIQRIVIVDPEGQCADTERLDQRIAIITPQFGHVSTSCGFWLRALMDRFQVRGSWCALAEVGDWLSMEFNEESSGADGNQQTAKTADHNSLHALISVAEAAGLQHISGLEIEWLPPSEPIKPPLAPWSTWDATVKDWCYYFRPSVASGDYGSDPSVRQAFGTAWPVAHGHDVAFRLFGTPAPMLRIPLIQFTDTLDFDDALHGLWQHGAPLTAKQLLQPAAVLGLVPVNRVALAHAFYSHHQDNALWIHAWRTWQNTPFKASELKHVFRARTRDTMRDFFQRKLVLRTGHVN